MEEKTTKEQSLLNENRRLFNQVSKLNIENKKLVEELEEAKETYENLYESYRSECAGNIKTQEQAVQVAGKTCTVMLFGLASPEESFPLKPDDVFKKELKITSSFINPYTFERAIAVLESKIINLESLITDVVPVDNIADVFTKPEYRRTGKIMIQLSE